MTLHKNKCSEIISQLHNKSIKYFVLEAMKKQYADISETNIIDIVKQWLVKAKERLGKEKPEENK